VSLQAWCDHNARHRAVPSTDVLDGVPSSADPLATAIRQHLDARKLGISVEESELPAEMLSHFQADLSGAP
jgi:hypothetical protein